MEGLRAFQEALTVGVWKEIIARRWHPLGQDATRLNRFYANDGSLPREIVGDTVTYKRLHFDPHSILFSHLYEPLENLSGGEISLVDVRSYLGIVGLSLDEVFRPSRIPGHEHRLVAVDKHRDALLAEHSVRLRPPSPGDLLLVMVVNDPFMGVAHEIADIRTIEPDKPIARRFFRTSIAPHH
jgi:hypothetical protein